MGPLCTVQIVLTHSFLQGKSRQWNLAHTLFAMLCILAVSLLYTEAGVPFVNLYKSIVYMIRCMPEGLHSPREMPFFFSFLICTKMPYGPALTLGLGL